MSKTNKHCPKCGSKNIRKIARHKKWICNECGYMFGITNT